MTHRILEIVSKGEVHQVLVDDSDYDMVKYYTWHILWDRGIPYVQTWIECGHRVKLHHYVLSKPPAGMIVAHINGKTLDNRKHNLQLVPRENNFVR